MKVSAVGRESKFSMALATRLLKPRLCRAKDKARAFIQAALDGRELRRRKQLRGTLVEVSEFAGRELITQFFDGGKDGLARAFLVASLFSHDYCVLERQSRLMAAA